MEIASLDADLSSGWQKVQMMLAGFRFHGGMGDGMRWRILRRGGYGSSLEKDSRVWYRVCLLYSVYGELGNVERECIAWLAERSFLRYVRGKIPENAWRLLMGVVGKALRASLMHVFWTGSRL